MISEWIICPICGNKTRDRVMEDSRHLTQEGYDVISKIVPRNEAMIAESMEVLDQEEKEKLLYLLKKIGGKL